MSLFKCEICGGNVIVNTQSATGTCNSCGGVTQYEQSTVQKYGDIYKNAKRTMAITSKVNLKTAVSLFESIPFVEGSSENIVLCLQMLNELENREATNKTNAQTDEKSGFKVGIILAIAALVTLCVLTTAAVIFARNVLNGTTSKTALVFVGVIIVVIAVSITIGKIKN